MTDTEEIVESLREVNESLKNIKNGVIVISNLLQALILFVVSYMIFSSRLIAGIHSFSQQFAGETITNWIVEPIVYITIIVSLMVIMLNAVNSLVKD